MIAADPADPAALEAGQSLHQQGPDSTATRGTRLQHGLLQPDKQQYRVCRLQTMIPERCDPTEAQALLKRA